MNDNEQKENLLDAIESSRNHQKPRFHLNRIHQKWWFWVGAFFIFVAIMYYIYSIDFAFAPYFQPK